MCFRDSYHHWYDFSKQRFKTAQILWTISQKLLDGALMYARVRTFGQSDWLGRLAASREVTDGICGCGSSGRSLGGVTTAAADTAALASAGSVASDWRFQSPQSVGLLEKSDLWCMHRQRNLWVTPELYY